MYSGLANRFASLEISPKGNGSGEEGNASSMPSKSGKKDQKTKQLSNPLVWIDLEMTGLVPDVDCILEIACVVTDADLRTCLEGPDIVVHHPIEVLESMNDWSKKHHEESGLSRMVQDSNISTAEAEDRVLEFIDVYVSELDLVQLAGNSVYVDLLFLKKYMPRLASRFSHVLVDVSTVTSLGRRWYPTETSNRPTKRNHHRALSDIKESIEELRFFKNKIFKPLKGTGRRR